MESLFSGLFDTDVIQVIGVGDFLACLGVSLVLGLITAFAYTFRSRYTDSFAVTLALLPAVVCVVILMVNGNIGAGVAIAGAFGLVRFRSVPGTAKEICAIFLSMATGLITGMGYLGYAALYTVILSGAFLLYSTLAQGVTARNARNKTLSVLIPENLDYSGIFSDIFEEYTLSSRLIKVKTTNMGSMLTLTYEIALRDGTDEKAMLDKIRCRNGNLEIVLAETPQGINEL